MSEVGKCGWGEEEGEGIEEEGDVYIYIYIYTEGASRRGF